MLLLVTAQAGEITPEHIAGTTKVTADDVIDLVDKFDDLLIIDARTAADYEKGHISDSINLSNVDTNEASLAKIIPKKTTPVVFYCNGIKCGRSVKSCQVAVAAGYKNIYWMRGGIAEWKENGYPIE